MNKKSNRKYLAKLSLTVVMLIVSVCITASAVFASWLGTSLDGSFTTGTFFDTLTIKEGSSVTFTDGTRDADLPLGAAIPDVTNNNTGKDIAGWYDVNNTSSYWMPKEYDFKLRDRTNNSYGINGSKELADFAMPAKDITVAPFFVEEDVRPLIPASHGIDNGSGIITREGTKFYVTDIGTQIGGEFIYSGGVYPNATPSSGNLSGVGYFRMLTACASSNDAYGAIEVKSHKFYYWFKNLGTETMSFDVLQGSNGTAAYGGDARMLDIELEAGETISFSVILTPHAKNGNVVTNFIFRSDHTEVGKSARFAMTMAMAEYTPMSSLSLDDSADVTFADGSKTKQLVAGAEMPDIIYNGENEIEGWYDVNNEGFYGDGSYWNPKTYDIALRNKSGTPTIVPSFTMPAADTTVAPFYSPENTRALVIGAQSSDSTNVTRDGTNFYETDIGTQIGAQVTYVGDSYPNTLPAGAGNLSGGTGNGYFRMLSGVSNVNSTYDALLSGVENTFYYWVKNLGEETIEFTIYQGNSGSSVYAGANSGEITLDPGDERSVLIDLTMPGNNNNAVTIIVFHSNHTAGRDAKFAIATALKLPPKYSLTLDDGADVTFADGSKTRQVFVKDGFPEVINNNTGTDIAGWYDVSNHNTIWKQTLKPLAVFGTANTPAFTSSFGMPANNITVAPFFVEKDYRPLAAGSHNVGGGTGTNITATMSKAMFFETDIGTQIGAEFTCAGDIALGGNFRFLTRCATGTQDANPGALQLGEHTFSLWFKNTGEEEIKFQVYQSSGSNINAGMDPGLPIENFTEVITLAPGASHRASITYNLDQANANTVTFIFFRQATTDAKFAVTISKTTANEAA